MLFADLLTLTTNGGKNDASVRNHNEFYEQQKENNRRRIEEEDILFYTVQNEANANRLRTTGYPFPSEPNKSDIGEGVYSWETYEEALSHKSHLENNRGVAGLEIMVLGIKKGVFANLLQKDLTLLSDNNREIWHRRYAKTWGGVPNHGLQYIRRANRFGFEHYFHHSIFHLLKFY
ncbi:hypothetical protein [Thermoflexibacter ruber]|uniref:hypothetical protein n=1 Tax=Thermoflexibacter ruber TaxID=1003 RepID=UPI0011600DE4|nr:hypothetical protein [Thermoflexibacter ruber]